MSLKDDLIKWNDGVNAYDAEDYHGAMELFEEFADTAKSYFNIAVVAFVIRDFEKAIDALIKAINLDSYFSVAYFQLGVCYYVERDYEQAIDAFSDCLLYLRGNALIDYTQLGMEYQLFSAEVLYNRAASMGKLDGPGSTEALRDLYEAERKFKIPDQLDSIQAAIRRNGDGMKIYTIPMNAVFRPPQDKIKNLKKMDFLGKSNIVAAADVSDSFVGFKGPQIRKAMLADSLRRSNTISIDGRNGRQSMFRRGSENDAGKLSKLSNSSALGSSKPIVVPTPMQNRPGFIKSASFSVSNGRPRPRRSFSISGMAEESHDSWQSKVSDENAPLSVSINAALSSGRSRSESPLQPFGLLKIKEDDEPSRYESIRRAPRRTDSTSTTSFRFSSGPKIKVKCHFGDTRIVMIDDSTGYRELLRRVREKFTNSQLLLRYKDDDGDLIMMADDEDLSTALSLLDGKLEVYAYLDK